MKTKASATDKIFLRKLEKKDVLAWVSRREGETKLGEKVLTLEGLWGDEALDKAVAAGARWAVLGIPEDIGIRANGGRPGACGAWEAFLSAFLNTQVNDFCNPGRVLLLGSIDCDDLMESCRGVSDTHILSEACASLDERVTPVIERLVRHKLTPVVIGGGHNNCYPIIKGCYQAWDGLPLMVINCDPHADFRRLEGRHSGNGFSTAWHENLLCHYSVLGLQEAYNNQDMLAELKEAGAGIISYEDVFLRGLFTWESALEKFCLQANNLQAPVGLELDMDALAGMPCSALSPYGLSIEQAGRYIYKMSHTLPCAYLHLPEGAPSLGGKDGARQVGRALSWLVRAFIS